MDSQEETKEEVTKRRRRRRAIVEESDENRGDRGADEGESNGLVGNRG